MDYLSYLFSSSIQFGFDIATSLTIIGSLFYFVISMRRRSREERSQRFDKQVRAVAAEQLRRSIDPLASIFIDSVIRHSEEFKKAFGLSDNKGLETERQRLRKEGRAELAIEKLDNASNAVGDFFEVLHKEKYNIIPVIDSIEDDEKLVEQFNQQMHKIAMAYNNLNQSVSPLIKTLMSLSNEIRSFCKDKEVSSYKEFHELTVEAEVFGSFLRHAGVIVYDEDYLFWTKSFIDDDLEAGFEDAVRDTSSLNEMTEEYRDIFIRICEAIVETAFEEPEKFYAQLFFAASERQKESNSECKEALINLSSILKYLLKSDHDSIKLSETIDQYKTDEYFNLSSSIR